MSSPEITLLARAMLSRGVDSFVLFDATGDELRGGRMRAAPRFAGEVRGELTAFDTPEGLLDGAESIVVLGRPGVVPRGFHALIAALVDREFVGATVRDDLVELRGSLDVTVRVADAPASNHSLTIGQSLRTNVKFPVRMRVAVPRMGGALPLGTGTGSYELSFPPGEHGEFDLELDFPHDSLVVRCARAHTLRRGRAPERPLHVFLAYDATCADVESLDASLSGRAAADEQASLLDAQAGSPPPQQDAVSANLKVRTLVGRALEQALPADTRVSLYWFAGEGAFGAMGNGGNAVAARLLDGIFEHRVGVDATDAVDEVLERIVRDLTRIGAERRAVVVVVGDSPPPPSGMGDPMMPILFDRPRVGSRFSPTLEGSLEALGGGNVDVVYVFLRPTDPKVNVSLPASYHEFSERVFEALAARFPRAIATDRTLDELTAAFADALVPQWIPRILED